MRSTLPHAALTGRYVPLILAGNPLPQHDTQRQSFDVNRLTLYYSSAKHDSPQRHGSRAENPQHQTRPTRTGALIGSIVLSAGFMAACGLGMLLIYLFRVPYEQKDELRKEADPNGLCYQGPLARVYRLALTAPSGACAIGVISPARTWSPGAASPSPSPRPSNGEGRRVQTGNRVPPVGLRPQFLRAAVVQHERAANHVRVDEPLRQADPHAGRRLLRLRVFVDHGRSRSTSTAASRS